MAKQKPIEENFDNIDNYDPSLDDPALDAEFEKEMQDEMPTELNDTENSEIINNEEQNDLEDFEKEVKKVEKKKQPRKKSAKKTTATEKPKKRKTKKQKDDKKELTDKEDLESFKVPEKPKEIDTDYLDTIITRKATEKVDVPKIDEIE